MHTRRANTRVSIQVYTPESGDPERSQKNGHRTSSPAKAQNCWWSTVQSSGPARRRPKSPVCGSSMMACRQPPAAAESDRGRWAWAAPCSESTAMTGDPEHDIAWPRRMWGLKLCMLVRTSRSSTASAAITEGKGRGGAVEAESCGGLTRTWPERQQKAKIESQRLTRTRAQTVKAARWGEMKEGGGEKTTAQYVVCEPATTPGEQQESGVVV